MRVRTSTRCGSRPSAPQPLGTSSVTRRIVKTGDWYDFAKTAASGGSYGRSNSSDASASIYFEGTRLDWIAMKGTTTGSADVYLDDEFQKTVDLSASVAAYQVKVWSSDTLSAGRHKVEIKRSGSNPGTEYITLDAVDVMGVLTDANPVAATITGISPGSASAGTGSTVTITGSHFGAAPGALGSVNFFYRSGQPTIPGDIVSWSDTSIVARVPVGAVNGYDGSAGSGPVTVTNADGATSPGYDFQVTFGYGEARWADPSVSFRVNPNCQDTSQEQALIDAAAATWSGPSVFVFTDAGTCSTSDFYDDGQNDLFWSSEMLASGVIAAALPEVSGSTISETDVCFNDYYLWGDGTSGTMDVQTIALHELGHWLQLRDLYGNADSAKVMYGFGEPGEQARTLAAEDRAGIVWIYGPPPTPVITSASPSAGPVAGGASVVITGSGFKGLYGSSAVRFGSADAASYTVDSATQITAVSPPDPGADAGITVTNAGGTSNRVDYDYVTVPSVRLMSSKAGPLAGGVRVQIFGEGFSGAFGPSAVTFGGVDAAEFEVVDDGLINAWPPAHAEGTVDVVIVAAGGTSASSGTADDYTYVGPPTITSIQPAFGPEAGGTGVVITGTNFLTGGNVPMATFAGQIAGGVVDDSTRMVVSAPPHAAGTVDVVVVAAGGSSNPSGTVDDYTYKVPPTVTALTPSSAPIAGGTAVTITGTGFTDVSGWTSVTFGGTPATSYTVESPTEISAVTPAHVFGTFDVVVIAGGIPSATAGTGNDFTFIPPLPSVTALDPQTGPTTGGTSVGITGINFEGLSGPSAVTFGGTDALSWVGDSSTHITAVAPAHAAGTVDVMVTTSQGVSTAVGTGNDFTYVAPTRYEQDDSHIVKSGDWYDFTKLGLASADSYGRSNTPGASATIYFEGTQVDWIAMTGSSPGIVLVYLDGDLKDTIDLYSSSAVYDRRVWSSGAINYGSHKLELKRSAASLSGEYITLDAVDIVGAIINAPPPPAAITAVSPSSGPLTGGTSVTVAGTSLTGATSVAFGGASATAVSVNNAGTQLTPLAFWCFHITM